MLYRSGGEKDAKDKDANNVKDKDQKDVKICCFIKN